MRLVGEQSLGSSIFPDGQGTEATHIVGSRCPACGDVRFPVRELCPLDGTRAEPASFAATGTIYEAVRVELAPGGFTAPYWIGYVDLDEKLRIFAQIAVEDSAPDPAHGDRVQMVVEVVRQDDEPVYGPVFRRIGDDDAPG